MKRIALTKDKFALVDDSDYDRLNQWKWHSSLSRKTCYACRKGRKGKESKKIIMHREILGLRPGDGRIVDHIDGNGLNNQRSNLRLCAHQENMLNRPGNRGSKSKYKGIYWSERKRRWIAEIRYKLKKERLGLFKSEVDAAMAYDRRAKELFGEFAKLNFPLSAMGNREV